MKWLDFLLMNKNPIKYWRKKGVTIGSNCRFIGCPKFGTEPYLITIGNHVSISSGCSFLTHEGAHWVLKGLDSKYNDTFGYGIIEIGNNVYIGQNVTVLRGISIGDNVIVGACSLVNKSLDPNCVYAGVPAKKICTVEEFAKKIMDEMPEFSLENYKNNKKDELLKIKEKLRKR